MKYKSLSIKPKAVVFDWDETLADTRSAIIFCMDKVLTNYNMPNWDIVKKEKRDNAKSLKENFINFFGDNWVKAYDEYLCYYKQIFKKYVSLCPRVRETLELLRDQQVKLIIVSNKEKSLLLAEVNYLLKDISFWKILGNGVTDLNKPSSQPIEKAFRHSGIIVNPSNVWLVGDSKQDIECAYQAHCLPVLIGHGKFITDSYVEEKRVSELPIINFSDFREFINVLRLAIGQN
jgi:phosphoglycolate phosphatase